jgi:hypothetical protein
MCVFMCLYVLRAGVYTFHVRCSHEWYVDCVWVYLFLFMRVSLYAYTYEGTIHVMYAVLVMRRNWYQCMYVCIVACYICAYVCVCMRACIFRHVRVYNMHACMYAYVCVCVCVHDVCICMYIHTYMYRFRSSLITSDVTTWCAFVCVCVCVNLWVCVCACELRASVCVCILCMCPCLSDVPKIRHLCYFCFEFLSTYGYMRTSRRVITDFVHDRIHT